MCIVRCTSLEGCVSVSVKLENDTLTCGFFDKSPLSYENSASYASDYLGQALYLPQVSAKCKIAFHLI